MEITQYEIVIVNLDPTIGSEIKKTRPCLVISPNEMNNNIRTVVIAPITSTSKLYPTRIEISDDKIKGWVVLDQIRTIDKRRIIKKAGFLNNEKIKEVKNTIKAAYVD